MHKIILLLLFFTLGFSQPITPLKSMKVEPKKVELGHELFFDTRLSKNNTISCASCHDLENGGDDGLKFAFGINGAEGDINSPTVYNAVYNFRQFWDGRAKDLADQATGPVQNPIEMGHDFTTLVKELNKTSYKKKFADIYDDGITKNNIANAIAEFEKTLVTLNAPFDKYLRGEENAVNQDVKDGYNLFKQKGCIACHHGINVGGNLYNKFGIMQMIDSKRLGRYEITAKEEDKLYFKVPTLRNIELTAPYLHDGRYKKLDDTVKFMARYQLGRILTEDEIKKIVIFLKSLTGEIPQSAKR